MLIENEFDQPRDPAMLPYQQLAVAIIYSAMVDFGIAGAYVGDREKRASPRRLRSAHQLVLESRLSTLRLQIRAGAFLVERHDENALLWFKLAGLNIEAARRRKPQWAARLQALREREDVLVGALKKKLQALMKEARAKRYVGRAEDHPLLGRYAEQRGAMQRPALRPEDRVGAGLLLWPEDVLRRARRALAYIDGRADGPRDRPHGRLSGSLVDLSRLAELQEVS